MRIYTARYKIAGLIAAKTLLLLTVPTNKVDMLISSSASNGNNEGNEQIELLWQKVNVLGTPTATAVTPSKHEQGDAAAASTVKADVTANEPTYVADTELGRKGVPSINGYEWPLTEKEWPVFAGGDTWGLRLIAPAAPTSFDCLLNVTFAELG